LVKRRAFGLIVARGACFLQKPHLSEPACLMQLEKATANEGFGTATRFLSADAASTRGIFLRQGFAPSIAFHDGMVPGEVFLIAAPAEEHRFSVYLGGEVDETDAEVPILEEAPNGLELAQLFRKLTL